VKKCCTTEDKNQFSSFKWKVSSGKFHVESNKLKVSGCGVWVERFRMKISTRRNPQQLVQLALD